MNVNLHNKLQQLGITHEYITRSGAHTWDFWKACLPKAIVFASRNFSEGTVSAPTDKPTNTPVNSVPSGSINTDPDFINLNKTFPKKQRCLNAF